MIDCILLVLLATEYWQQSKAVPVRYNVKHGHIYIVQWDYVYVISVPLLMAVFLLLKLESVKTDTETLSPPFQHCGDNW